MQDKRMTMEIARWEFSRWFKLKEQIITLLVSGVLSLLIFGTMKMVDKYSSKEKTIAVVSTGKLPLLLPKEAHINLMYHQPAARDSLIALCKQKQLDAVLVYLNPDSSELYMEKKGTWINPIQDALTALRRQMQLQKAGLTAGTMTEIFAEAKLQVHTMESVGGKTSTADVIAAGVLIGMMFAGVVLGLAYQFVAITGEKQLRITEVIVSAVSPQTWIDGKIIGISMLSFVLLITYILSSLLFVLVAILMGSGWSLPLSAAEPGTLLLLLLFALLGFALWNTFFAAIAATINDPNTSARGSLMMLPAIPAAVAFFAFGNPDSVVMRILSIFPLTAAPVMSVRLALTSVPWYELLLSVLLLALSVHALRVMAGKIFALSILMYGKEPSFSEMAKWLKKDTR